MAAVQPDLPQSLPRRPSGIPSNPVSRTSSKRASPTEGHDMETPEPRRRKFTPIPASDSQPIPDPSQVLGPGASKDLRRRLASESPAPSYHPNGSYTVPSSYPSNMAGMCSYI